MPTPPPVSRTAARLNVAIPPENERNPAWIVAKTAAETIRM